AVRARCRKGVVDERVFGNFVDAPFRPDDDISGVPVDRYVRRRRVRRARRQVERYRFRGRTDEACVAEERVVEFDLDWQGRYRRARAAEIVYVDEDRPGEFSRRRDFREIPEKFDAEE